MDADDDRSLILSVLSGRTEAFEPLVARYQGLVAGVGWKLGVPRAEIEDLVSDVFVKAYRSLEAYNPEFPFTSWLYRIAVNASLDVLRRGREARRTDELPDDLAAKAPGPGDELAMGRRAARLRSALATLPERDRVPLVLLYLESRTVAEIAAILRLSEGAVKTRLHRARARLEDVIRSRFSDLIEDTP